MEQIRGIECSLNGDSMYLFLEFIVQENYNYYSPWLLKTSKDKLLPESTPNINITQKSVLELKNYGLWEMVLHMYPPGVLPATIHTYDDFLKSECIGCFIYYDCGFLDIYIKKPVLFERIWNKLSSLNAEDMTVLTDENDRRTALSV